MKKKLLLAFSGGLDTSYCAVHLVKDRGFEVIAATINTGGFDRAAVRQLKEKAVSLGVSDYIFIDQTTNFMKRV